MTYAEAPREGSSAARELAAGDRPAVSRPRRLRRGRGRVASWINPKPLWDSRNDRIARLLGDPTNRLRRRWTLWLEHQDRRGDPTIAGPPGDRVRFVVLGDPGEGDFSQKVVVPPLLAVQDDSDFLVVCSDVVYPTGDVNDYGEKFYDRYAGWRKPIYALPGNHDWYDELEGFMFHLCGVESPPPGFGDDPPRPFLWRRPRRRRIAATRLRADRPAERGEFQPGPYLLIDTGPLAVVCIDTGIMGDLDEQQGRWLERVSSEVRKPKLLLTGKPLMVDGEYHPGTVRGLDRTVDDIVREPANGYVAAIGGDIHNYQRYPVDLDGRHIEYIVSGGGGAFMHATHRIGPVDLGGVREEQFRCFPLRGDSLAFYSRVVVKALRRLLAKAAGLTLVDVALVGGVAALLANDGAPVSTWILAELLPVVVFLALAFLWRSVVQAGALRVLRLHKSALSPKQAASWMAERISEETADKRRVHPTIGGARVDPGSAAAALADFAAPRFHHTGGFLHAFFSEIFDVDRAPLYKNFLHLDADADALRITCYAAVGLEDERDRPLVEERIEIDLASVRVRLATV